MFWMIHMVFRKPPTGYDIMLKDVSTSHAYRAVVASLFDDGKFNFGLYLVLKQFTTYLCRYHIYVAINMDIAFGRFP